MLVVVVIIGVIMGLISAAVVKARAAGTAARNRAEISQLELAVEAFKQKYGVYPPSRLLLCEKLSIYQQAVQAQPDLAQLAQDSIAFLTHMFPRLSSPNGMDRNYPWSYTGPMTGTEFVDWNGNRRLDTTPMILEGDQCLVFFLGGIPDNYRGGPPNCTGFSTNGSNPAAHIFPLPGGGDVNPSLFQFGSDRLVFTRTDGSTPLHPLAPRFFTYLDTYSNGDGTGRLITGMPYAYFSSYKTTNGYNRYCTAQSLVSDCASLQVWPYAEFMGTSGPPIYLKPDGFQIISAGPDHAFGTGTRIVSFSPQGYPIGAPMWTRTLAPSVYPEGTPGHDDQANFTSSILGSGGE
jgi:hypothetical protein